jgi:histidinol phosphatase-like enzyme (inositol monophosphatase family)
MAPNALAAAVDLSKALAFARDAAVKGGEISLRYFQKRLRVRLKADGSPVTIADREVETYIREAIRAAYPDHGIVGEEAEPRRSASPFTWVVDPIDGTFAFIRGVPLYGVMIALEHDGVPVLGVVNCPAVREIVYAADGAGCWWNGHRCTVSRVAKLKDSLVVASAWHGSTVRTGQPSCARLVRAAAAFRTWGHCYGFVLVATGRAEVMIDAGLKRWDSAALVPILHQAGGTITDWRGRSIPRQGNVLATNGLVLTQSLRRLTK